MKPQQLLHWRLWLVCLILYLTGIPNYAQVLLLDPNSVPKFVNKLPIPSVIDATKSNNTEITMTISQFNQDLGLGLLDDSGNPKLIPTYRLNS